MLYITHRTASVEVAFISHVLYILLPFYYILLHLNTHIAYSQCYVIPL